MILKHDYTLCNKEGQKKIKGKGIWTTEASAVFECQGWRTVLESAKITGTRRSYGRYSQVSKITFSKAVAERPEVLDF